MVNGEGGKVVLDANAGLVCPAESPEALAENIIIMKEMSSEKISKMGVNARKYYENNFERSFLFNRAEKIFASML